jgi:hypothetical protein
VIDPTVVLVATAIALFMVTAVFLAVVGVGWWRRNRGRPVGSTLEAAIAILGGSLLGLFIVNSQGMLALDFVFFVTTVLIAYGQWRRRRRRLAGLLVAGFALPWTILWGFYVAQLGLGVPFEPVPTWAGFLGGLAIVVAGMALVALGDPPPPAPDPAAAPGDPGSRRIGTIALAILGPARIGPFRTPDLASLIGLVLSWIIVGSLPLGDRWLTLGLAVVVGAGVASEAWIRALPARTRLAFEAFSWLGEADMARFRALTGTAVPVTRQAAEQWLARVPESPLTNWARAEVLILAERPAEARAILERMPTGTPAERFEQASAQGLVEWANGGSGDTAEMEAGVESLGPDGSDARLRGEVAIAAARVRLAMDAGQPNEGDVLEPLVQVRARLGSRADGQVGRAMRPRLIRAYLLFGALIVFGGELLFALAADGPASFLP